MLSDRGHGDRSSAATGQALLALASDRRPATADFAGLRRAMRSVIAHHLGARGLKSWEMLGDLARMSPVASPQPPTATGIDVTHDPQPS